MALTIQTQELVAQIIAQQCYFIRECEVQKEVLAKEPQFLLLNVFQRIDANRRMQLDTLDLCAFFRENNLVVSEADCYMLVKQLDSNGDGMLNLSDIMNLLCPRSYTTTKNIKATRKHITYGQ